METKIIKILLIIITKIIMIRRTDTTQDEVKYGLIQTMNSNDSFNSNLHFRSRIVLKIMNTVSSKHLYDINVLNRFEILMDTGAGISIFGPHMFD